ncbi:MAG: adenylate/guanylate cyclase domain-containing protein, partial [Desulfosarcina sp.]|nr:adenylate/guanylate cyclase domain-containing protein [Desulfosarcina sp.]MBC2767164.1 adenylate/guanylate cyclase domain-containing protein [Desulfosarcina sp.]
LGRVCRGIDRGKCIIVRNPMVSRDHAVVRLTRYGVEITDMSKNGTWVNDVRMAPGASRQLEDGDLISLGGTSIRLFCPHLAPQPEKENWTEQTAISPTAICVTSLVADVRGFSAFSQKVDSAVVYAFIKEIFSRFSTIVNEHHGTVKDYIGDAVFAFWEHPGGFSPDHALSACQAAICQLRSGPEIHRQLTDRGLVIPPPVLGWGLTTGQVTLSHYGSRPADLALVGDCINLAFRLSSMANKTLPGPIVMCRQTASLVTQQLPLMDLGNQEIRGRTGQEHLFGIQLG